MIYSVDDDVIRCDVVVVPFCAEATWLGHAEWLSRSCSARCITIEAGAANSIKVIKYMRVCFSCICIKSGLQCCPVKVVNLW